MEDIGIGSKIDKILKNIAKLAEFGRIGQTFARQLTLTYPPFDQPRSVDRLCYLGIR